MADYIIRYQHLFFRHGFFCLKPLLQKDVAARLNISSSTVSRIVNSKYIQFGSEFVLFKDLCPRSYCGKTGEQLKYLISDLFNRFPDYSDQKIVTKCNEMGVKIARRTVTKYRLKADISPRFKRRMDT